MMNEDKVREALGLARLASIDPFNETAKKIKRLLEEALAPDVFVWKPEPGELVLVKDEGDIFRWVPRHFRSMRDGKFDCHAYDDEAISWDECKPHPTHLHKQPNTGVAPDCEFVWVKIVAGDCHVVRTAALNWALTTDHRKVNVIKQFAIIE